MRPKNRLGSLCEAVAVLAPSHGHAPLHRTACLDVETVAAVLKTSRTSPPLRLSAFARSRALALSRSECQAEAPWRAGARSGPFAV